MWSLPSTTFTTVKDLPVGIAVKTSDSLSLVALGNATGLGVYAVINITQVNGDVTSQQLTANASSDRSVPNATLNNALTDGVITSASIGLAKGTTPANPGNLYARLGLLRGGAFTAIICSGYIYTGAPGISYPGTLVGLQDGPGRVANVFTASTALLAAGVSIGPPAGAKWKVNAIRVKLITSGNAGSRLMLLYMSDGTVAPVSGTEGTNVVEEWVNSGTFGTGRTVVASTTEVYKITGLMTVDASATINKIIQTPFYVPNGFGIFIQDTAAIDAVNDRVTIDVYAEEWISG